MRWNPANPRANTATLQLLLPEALGSVLAGSAVTISVPESKPPSCHVPTAKSTGVPPLVYKPGLCVENSLHGFRHQQRVSGRVPQRRAPQGRAELCFPKTGSQGCGCSASLCFEASMRLFLQGLPPHGDGKNLGTSRGLAAGLFWTRS